MTKLDTLAVGPFTIYRANGALSLFWNAGSHRESIPHCD